LKAARRARHIDGVFPRHTRLGDPVKGTKTRIEVVRREAMGQIAALAVPPPPGQAMQTLVSDG